METTPAIPLSKDQNMFNATVTPSPISTKLLAIGRNSIWQAKYNSRLASNRRSL